MKALKLISCTATGLAIGLVSFGVAGQQATERYIPIGKSPGISREYSYVGKIVSVDRDTMTLVVEDDRGRHTFKVTEATQVWRDRSKRRRPALAGTYSDCRVGRQVELMYTKDDKKVARWIKIEER